MGNGPAGDGVERPELAAGGEKDPTLVTLGPIHDAAVHVGLTPRLWEWIEPPKQCPLVGAERDHGEGGRGRVENAVHHDRRRLDLGLTVWRDVTRVIGPRQSQARDVAAIDLGER